MPEHLTSLAVGASMLMTATFVGPLYILKRTRVGDETARDEHGAPLTRDHATVIKWRLLSTSCAMPVCAWGVWGIARSRGLLPKEAPLSLDIRLTLALVGLRTPHTVADALALVIMPATLTLMLYSGPLLSLALEGRLPGMRKCSWSRIKRTLMSWQGFRNYIHAPICEEFVFRGCIIAAGALTRVSKTSLIFATPLYFGLAHVHHAYETYLQGGRTTEALRRGLVQSAVQFSYTYLSGVYGAWLFLRSSSIIPPIVAHIICNVLGLPQPLSEIDNHPSWRWGILGSYSIGIVQFARGLTTFTQPYLFGPWPWLYWPL